MVDSNAAETPLYEELLRRASKTGADVRRCRHDVGDVVVSHSGEARDTTLIFERKKWADWVASVKDGRYHDQKNRALHACDHADGDVQFVYLVESREVPAWSTHHGGSASSDYPMCCAVLKTALRDKIPVLFTRDTRDTATLLMYVHTQLVNDKLHAAPQASLQPTAGIFKRKSTCKKAPGLQFEAMLSTIQGMSFSKARALRLQYSDFATLLRCSEEQLAEVKVGERKIGPRLAGRIKAAMRGE